MKISSQMTEVNSKVSNTNLVTLDETGSDSSPESDVQVIKVDNSKRTKNSDDTSSLRKKLADANAENMVLKEKLAKFSAADKLIIGPTDDPVAILHFTSDENSRKYRKVFQKALKNISEEPDSDDDITEIKCKEPASFFIDNKAHHSKHKSSRKYPIYHKEITEIMTDEVAPEKEMEDKPRNTCFNCGGDHMMNECSKPYDRQQVAMNRKGFFNKFGGKQNRYHADTEILNSKFKPGVLSPELRKALHVGENHLPLHIYRMRVLGYPPGWLREAEVVSSGLTLYDTHGREVTDYDNLEEGEVKESGTSIRVQYDPSKLVEYPGFNMYPQSGTIDEYEALGFPSIQEHQLKTAVERRMKPPPATPYKRKSECLGAPSRKSKTPRLEDNMEIDDDNPISTQTQEEEPPVCTPVKDLGLIRNPSIDSVASQEPSNISGTSSPSIEELERQKNQLMEQLESSDSSQSTSNLATTPVTTPATKVTRSKSICLGTPVLDSLSPFKNLPDASKFSATISDHMNFENLPNSTGSYDKLKELLVKIREKTKQ